MNSKAGDRVHIIREDKEIDGVLLPEQNHEILLVKLDSGYNIGITKKNIKKITVIGKKPIFDKKEISKEKEKDEKEKTVKKPESQQKDLPLITILHTGGTIASRVDYKTGAVVAKFTPEDLLSLIPELDSICRVRSVFVANVQSESMRFGHYNLMAKAIEKELKEKEKPKGIIITHGTDTMHYSAAALSFMLENIDVPIILVGAQRSSDRGSSDSAMNVVCAARFIAQSTFKGVALCMHKNMDDLFGIILPACKSRKLHTSRRDAFKPVNTNPIAEVAYKENIVKFLSDDYYQPPPNKLTIKYFKETIKVGLFKTHTNTYPEDYAYFKNHEGLIIEGTGLGHAQTTGFDDISKINEKNKQALAEVCKKAVVVLTSQCIFGRVNMNIYSPQRELLDIGVIPGDDMTAETALIKLAWLLSNYSKEETKKLMRKNLRGEVTERSLVDNIL